MKAALFLPQDAGSIVVPSNSVYALTAVCYGCGAPLAVYGWGSLHGRANRTLVAMGLIRRPDIHEGSGLARFGPPRREGGRSRHDRVNNSPRAWREWGSQRRPFDFYVNCHHCDRGQVVRAPHLESAPPGVLMFPLTD